MPKTDESLIDIAAEIRAARNTASDMTLVPNEWLTQWADRIEAATKREREAAQSARDTRDAMDYAAAAALQAFVGVDLAKDKPTYACVEIAPGNAAAMREALESTEELLEHFAKPGTMLGDAFLLHMRDNRAALAAPARNCDVGTAEEQTRRLRANCEKYKPSCKGCKFLTDIQHENCWLKWAQMPYDTAEGETKCIDGLRGHPDCRGCDEHCLDVRKRNCFFWNQDIGKCALDGRPSCRIACDNFHVSKEEKPGPAEGGAK